MLGEAGKKPVNPTAKKPAAKKKLRAGESKEFPGYFWKGGLYYSNVSKDGQVTHKKDKGRMVALTNQEKAEYRAKRAGKSPAKPAPQAQPATQGYGKDFIGGLPGGVIPQRPSLQTPDMDASISLAQSELERRSKGATNADNKKILDELLAAIKSRNPKQIQKVLTDYGIEMSKEGKLKAKKLGKKSDQQKLVPDGKGKNKDAEKRFAANVNAALQSLGVELPGAQPTTTTSTSTATWRDFQAQPVFSAVEGVKLDRLDVEDITDENGRVVGLKVEGVEITEITEGQEDRIVTALVKAARRRLSEKVPPETPSEEWMQNFERYIRRRIAVTNINIQYLRDARDGKAYQFEGEEGGQQIAEGLRSLVSQHLPPDRQKAANDAIEEMRTARDPQSFSAAWQKFFAALPPDSPMAKNGKFVAEIVTALGVVAAGGVALIPADTTFQLADVIALSRSSLTGGFNIDIIISDFATDLDVSPAASTKFVKGAASVNWQKILYSRFFEGQHDGVDISHQLPSLLPIPLGKRGKKNKDGELEVFPESQKEAEDRAKLSGVQGDLADLASTEMRDYIFDHPNEDEVNQVVRDYMERYGPMVRAYYGFPDEPPPSNDEIIAALSYGTGGFVECDEEKGYPRLASPDRIPYSEGQEGKPNYTRWRIWSSLGLINEAIHNRSVDFQCYSTHRFDKKSRIVADGTRTLSKMEFQAYKKKSNDDRKPDTRMNAKTTPASREETRDGNPCNQK